MIAERGSFEAVPSLVDEKQEDSKQVAEQGAPVPEEHSTEAS